MKSLKFMLAFAVATLYFVGCKNEKKPEIKTVETAVAVKDIASNINPNATFAKTEFTISGMTCAVGCAKKIEGKLAKMEGIKSAKVDFDRKLAMVEYDIDKVSPTDLTTAVTKVADVYKVSNIKTVDALSGKQCECKGDCKGNCSKSGKCECTDCKCEGCSGAKKACAKKDCKKDCKNKDEKACAKKSCKKECKNKAKKACAKDCEKDCCKKEAKKA